MIALMLVWCFMIIPVGELCVGELCVGDIEEVGDAEEVLWRLQFTRRRSEFKASIVCDLTCCPIHLNIILIICMCLP